MLMEDAAGDWEWRMGHVALATAGAVTPLSHSSQAVNG